MNIYKVKKNKNIKIILTKIFKYDFFLDKELVFYYS